MAKKTAKSKAKKSAKKSQKIAVTKLKEINFDYIKSNNEYYPNKYKFHSDFFFIQLGYKWQKTKPPTITM